MVNGHEVYILATLRKKKRLRKKRDEVKRNLMDLDFRRRWSKTQFNEIQILDEDQVKSKLDLVTRPGRSVIRPWAMKAIFHLSFISVFH